MLYIFVVLLLISLHNKLFLFILLSPTYNANEQPVLADRCDTQCGLLLL